MAKLDIDVRATRNSSQQQINDARHAASIRDWCTARFIAEQKDSTSAEIADGTGISLSTVRRVMRQHGGCVPGLGCWQVSRESHSKDYPMMSSGYHRVWTYGPTREELAKRLRP